MRITGPNAAAVATSVPATRRAAGGGFSLGTVEEQRLQSPAASLRTIGGIDALVALQAYEDPTEKRRRGVRCGRSALDALDQLKSGFLSGQLDSGAINRLKAIGEQLRETTGDSGLDGVLAEIELRVEVEIAKLARR